MTACTARNRGLRDNNGSSARSGRSTYHENFHRNEKELRQLRPAALPTASLGVGCLRDCSLISGQGLRGPIIPPQPIPPIIPPGPIICCIMAGIPSCTNPVTSRACARMASVRRDRRRSPRRSHP